MINTKKNIDQINYPYIYGNNNNWMTFEENFNKIILTGSYVGEYEIINTCIEFRCNICIYKLDRDNKSNIIYTFETIRSNQVLINPFLPTILLTWVDNNHYEILLPTNMPTNATNDLPIEPINQKKILKYLH